MAEHEHIKSPPPSGREEVQDMLGNPPGWALRWGISAVLVAVVLLIGLLWFIRYPNVVTARVSITTPQPPVRLIVQQSGRLEQLRVQDGEPVARGQLLAVMENTARETDVLLLDDWLQEDTISAPPAGLRVGALQPAYAQLQQSWGALEFARRRTDINAQLSRLQQQLQRRGELSAAFAEKQATLQEELVLAKRNESRNQALQESGNVSKLEAERAAAEVLRYRRQLQDVEAEQLQNRLAAEELQQRQIRLQQEREAELQQLRQDYRSSHSALLSAVAGWKQNKLCLAPLSGQVAMQQALSEGQFLPEGELLMAIVPPMGKDSLVARGYMPVDAAGLVREGMTARLLLDAFPEMQFGTVPAQVAHIAPLPEEAAYYIELQLTQGMETIYGQELPFSQELPATARIITEDRRLLYRLTGRLRSLWERY